MIQFRAGERHFVDHLAPVWLALAPAERGPFCVPQHLRGHAARLGVTPVDRNEPGPVVVASYGDLKRARTFGPVAYMEHGAGQTYTGAPSSSYIGGWDRAGVVAVLVPGAHAVAAHQAASDLPAFAVGCPKMDRWHASPPPTEEWPVVAVTTHWDCYVCPETRSALRHYLSAIKRLAQRHTVLGHAHPRSDRRMARFCQRVGIAYTDDLDDVFARASVLVADNTSAMYEFASLARPVVALNAPWYRRDVEHGLRFWSHVPGEQVDTPDRLPEVVRRAIDSDPMRLRRAEVVEHVYARRGDAAAAAATVLREVFG